MSREIEEKITETTEDLVRFETVKGNDEEFKSAFDYIENYFSKTDLEVETYEFNEFRTMMVLNDPDPEIMLHGHIDVVPAEDEMFEPEVRDGKIFGRGTGDMKAGIATLMELMGNKVEGSDIPASLMIVSDEEIGGFNGAKRIVEEDLYSPEFVISAEPNNTEGYLEAVIEQKGIMRAEISATGKNAHGSKPWEGENAAEKLWKNYATVKENFEGSEDNWNTTVNLGVFNSGEAFNVVPDEAEAKLDIRWTEDYDPDEIQEDLESIEGLDFDVLAVDPMLKTDPENQYIEMLQETSRKVIDGKLELTRKEAASDVRHFSGAGIPGIVFGPEGYGIHEDGEYADIESFRDYYRIMEDFLEEADEI
ncbi:MAG: succinyl-diaminopimelate desuccinylase [Candidatus Nanohaloarchaea archaeon]|jgi:succinyl-diaminopimelate desuccinylase